MSLLIIIWLIFTIGALFGCFIGYIGGKQYSQQQLKFLQVKLDNANTVIKNLDEILKNERKEIGRASCRERV
jgi:membrane protein DedA with SNARE-associated domain